MEFLLYLLLGACAGVLAGLRASGLKTAILSNGSPDMLASAVASARLIPSVVAQPPRPSAPMPAAEPRAAAGRPAALGSRRAKARR